ncbi:Cupredoxin [Xylariales sp. AK1849]|nr:Cupredoxin [Xylariales sp. AK1849]
MQFLTVLSMAAAASAATVKINVGSTTGLVFDPDSVTAAKGDILEFHFLPLNHSVAVGDFDNACQPVKEGGFFSGFYPTTAESETIFSVTVNDTNPIWLYCTQQSHCQSGMVGVVNPPADGDQTLDAYKKKSTEFKDQSGEPAVPVGFGGTLSVSGGSGVSSSSSAAASGTATPTTSTSGTITATPSATPAGAPGTKVAVGGVLGAVALAAWGLI